MKNWKIGLGVPPQPAPKPARLPVSAAELARIGIPARKIPRILRELTALLQADPGLADHPTALRLARALDALLP